MKGWITTTYIQTSQFVDEQVTGQSAKDIPILKVLREYLVDVPWTAVVVCYLVGLNKNIYMFIILLLKNKFKKNSSFV